MGLAVLKGDLHPKYREAGQHPGGHCQSNPGVNRWDVLLGNPPTSHLVLKGVSVVLVGPRLHRGDDLCKLAVAASLLLVGIAVLLHRAGNRLSIGDLRLTHVGIHPKLSEHPIDKHL